MLHGWLILDKPVGIGSTACVGAVKRALRDAGEPRTRVGHGGTLDPLASGVLPIAIGEATKLAGRLLGATKEYDFTIAFGVGTNTLDGEGAIVATSERRPTLTEIEAVLDRFTGAIEQVPPAFSALRIGGRRAYDLARAGDCIAMEPRMVTVHSLAVRGSAADGGKPLDTITLAATVSKGTYVRSLARDIAEALGTVGHVTMLRRTRAGPFTLEKAISLDFVAVSAKARRLDGAVLPLAAGLDDIPALPVTPDQAISLRQGRRLVGFPAKPGLYLATAAGRAVALVESLAGDLVVVRGFNL